MALLSIFNCVILLVILIFANNIEDRKFYTSENKNHQEK